MYHAIKRNGTREKSGAILWTIVMPEAKYIGVLIELMSYLHKTTYCPMLR